MCVLHFFSNGLTVFSLMICERYILYINCLFEFRSFAYGLFVFWHTEGFHFYLVKTISFSLFVFTVLFLDPRSESYVNSTSSVICFPHFYGLIS